MAEFKSQSRAHAIAIRPLVSKGLLTLLFLLSLTLLFMERSDNPAVQQMRMQVIDRLTPAMEAMSQPTKAVSQALQSVNDLFYVYRENERLRVENTRLLQWQHAAQKLAEENASLRHLMNYEPSDNAHYVSAKVVGHFGSSLSHTIVIDAGTEQGIKAHQAVINDEGLIGRIIQVGAQSARVMLITDMNSRIPVMALDSKQRSILAGSRSDMPNLQFLHDKESPKLGEAIISAADGGVFPEGLMIGKVFSQDDDKVFIRPLVDFTSLDFIRVVQFDDPANAVEPLSAEPSAATPAP